MDTVNTRAEALKERIEIMQKLAVIGENLETNVLAITSDEAERHAKSYVRELDEIAKQRELWRNGNKAPSEKEEHDAEQARLVFKSHARQWIEATRLLKRKEYLSSVLPSLK